MHPTIARAAGQGKLQTNTTPELRCNATAVQRAIISRWLQHMAQSLRPHSIAHQRAPSRTLAARAVRDA